MSRVYQEANVYDATQERLRFIFENFKKVYVSFSGGKDSGVLLNLVIDYVRANGITQKIGVQILDNEANYTYSAEFMHRIIEANRDVLDVDCILWLRPTISPVLYVQGAGRGLRPAPGKTDCL